MNRRKFFTLAGLAGLGIAPNLVDAKEEDDDKIWIPKKDIRENITNDEKRWKVILLRNFNSNNAEFTFNFNFQQPTNYYPFCYKYAYALNVIYDHQNCDYVISLQENHWKSLLKECENKNDTKACMTDDFSKAIKELKF